MYRFCLLTRSLVSIILVALLILTTNLSVHAIPTTVVNLLVDTTSDDPARDNCTGAVNDCSLRGAIHYANTGEAAFSYHITLPSGVFTFDEVGSVENVNLTGDLDILSRTVTLTGAGTSLTTIDAATLDRALDIDHGTVTIEHLRIINGKVPAGDHGGGAIKNGYSSTVSLFDVLIEHNIVLGSNYDYDNGGGIANSGTLIISDSIVSDNEACSGGGVNVLNGTNLVMHSTISENLARSVSGCGYGGGILTSGSVQLFFLDHVLLEGNIAYEGGGLEYYGPSNMMISDSTFRNNVATDGSGIRNDGVLTLERDTLSGNQASANGGGVLNDGTLTMLNVTISGNQASGGGGLYNLDSKSITMDHCTIASNTATNVSFGNALHALANSQTTIHNSILASDFYGSTCKLISGSILTDLGYNLSSDHSCGFSTNAPYYDIIDTGPALGSLADNGGPTMTRAILWGGAAIDHADPDMTLIKDQRLAYRPVNGDAIPGAVSDIGAYEYNSFPPNAFFWLPLIFRQIFD